MANHYFSLAGKKALIIGGTSGIGFAVGTRFSEDGAAVIVTGRRVNEAVLSSACHFIYSDVTIESSVETALREAVAQLGGLDIAVINAGIALDDGAGVDDAAASTFDTQIQTNLRGAFLGLKYVAKNISDGGSIVLTSTGAANILFPGYLGYAASKAGLPIMARHAASQLGSRGIRVNCVSPGTIITAIQPAEDAEARICARHTCLGRTGTSEDVLGAFHFLASDQSRYVTATELVVDGGWAGGVTANSAAAIIEANLEGA
jgi:NAD(P)-dependent dehydrogenase (short-subunit alcohol dehydrogenase family)